jgi:hypothetical protein
LTAGRQAARHQNVAASTRRQRAPKTGKAIRADNEHGCAFFDLAQCRDFLIVVAIFAVIAGYYILKPEQ